MELYTPKIDSKTWGYEEIIARYDINGVTEYCGKRLHLKSGYRCSLHAHPKDETFYLESGNIFFEMENDTAQIEGFILLPREIVRILPLKKHRFSGLENAVIIEFSTLDCMSERFSQSEAIPDFEQWRKIILERYGRR